MTETGLTTRSIVLATLGAAALGGGIAVTVVLPAEYAYDPTGLGTKLGLTQLATNQPSNVPPQPASESPAAVDAEAPSRGQDAITLGPGEGMELKLTMQAGQKVSYRWIADTTVHVDLHGEPVGDDTGYYESYVVGNTDRLDGQFTAAFNGTHGWYWRNDGNAPVTISIMFAGEFESRVP